MAVDLFLEWFLLCPVNVHIVRFPSLEVSENAVVPKGYV